MLRTCDVLLTFAAVILLIGALDGKSRIIRASANSNLPQDRNEQVHHERNERRDHSESRMNHLMARRVVKRLNETPQRHSGGALQPDKVTNFDTGKLNSYNYFANKTNQIARQKENFNLQQPQQQHNAPQEVRIEFLRSSGGAATQAERRDTNKLPADQDGQEDEANNNKSLYLLNSNYFINNQPLHRPALQRANFDAAVAAFPPHEGDTKDNEATENEAINVSEQQQQPPMFTMFPPQTQPNQAQLNGQSLPVNNIREILNNYQRAYNGGQLPPAYNNALLQQHQLANLLRPPQPQHPSPPTQTKPSSQSSTDANRLQNHQQSAQQPFSPLQLLTGPLQALLPGLGQPQQRPPAQQGATSSGQTVDPAKNQQQPQIPGGLFNPFAPQANGQPQQPGQLPNLATLYQQLPLYQTLLAARQRQEALEAAQRMRQQQGNSVNNNKTPSSGLRPPYEGFARPQQPHLQQQEPQQPYLQPQVIGNQQPQPNYPTSQSAGPSSIPNGGQNPVQFDDDANSNNGQPENNEVNTQNNQQQPAQQNHSRSRSRNQQQQPYQEQQQNNQQHNDNNQQDNNNNNNNQQDDQGDHNGGAHDDNGGHQNEQAAKPEEEDPDLKQFQNLANGGDSFTDLFPPGILSNNDISEIKKQQDEQAKKQEEEERQKQLQQQQREQHQQQQNYRPTQAQRQFDQPINQFAGNSDNNQPQMNPPESGNTNAEDNNSEDNNSNEPANENEQPEDGGGEEEPDQDGNDGGGEDDGGGGGVEDGGTGNEVENPTAAALTSKSLPGAGKRFSQSPGVEYSSSKAA